jgi:hypothetical protein
MGLGWLAREEKLCFVQDHRVLKLALKVQRESCREKATNSRPPRIQAYLLS